MGRKPTGQTTTVIRIPKRFKQEVLDYVELLKASEVPEPNQISQALAAAREAGLIDLHGIAQTYGVSTVDKQRHWLPKERLRARIIEALESKI